MSESAGGTMASWNDMVITEFKAGQQRIGSMFDRSALLLLHTVGAKSGQPRTSPLAYLTIDGEIVIVASAGGAPSHPAWYFNLLAHPQVTIERWQDNAIESLEVKAVEVTGQKREQLWERLTAVAPGFAEYQTKTTRTIPVITLQPA